MNNLQKLLFLGSTLTLKQLPTFASATEAQNGKDGIKVTSGYNNYSVLGDRGESDTYSEATSFTFDFKLDRPAILDAFTWCGRWQNEWMGAAELQHIYYSDDDGSTWKELTFDYTLTRMGINESTVKTYWHENQKVQAHSPHKDFRFVSNSLGEGLGLHELQGYFKSF